MNTIDLTPLYRNSIGFDRFGSLLDIAQRSDNNRSSYPQYNIEVTGENQYAISLALAGFDPDDLNIQVENSVLTIRSEKSDHMEDHQYLYQGIATQQFEVKYNLADHIEVAGAKFNNGLLTVTLVKEIPEEMKPRQIEINNDTNVLDLKKEKDREVAA